MFDIGEVIIYKSDVCKVREIRKDYRIGKDYYILTIMEDDSLTIEIPTDNKLLRKIISKEEVENIISNIHNIPTLDSVNDKVIEQEYKNLLKIGNHRELIQIIKTAYDRNYNRIQNNKKIGEKDDNYFQIAEKKLYNEFAIALGKSYDETKKYVTDKVKKNIANTI